MNWLADNLDKDDLVIIDVSDFTKVYFSPSLFREVDALALNYFVLHDLMGYRNVQIFDGLILESVGGERYSPYG
ncbi:MAG: hypothetical protein ACLFV2_05520 [Desulfurivibrionaceae bacterium]